MAIRWLERLADREALKELLEMGYASTPVIVIDGQGIVGFDVGAIDRALAVEHMPLEEVLEAARQQGVDDLAKIRLAVLEVSGRISIITS